LSFFKQTLNYPKYLINRGRSELSNLPNTLLLARATTSSLGRGAAYLKGYLRRLKMSKAKKEVFQMFFSIHADKQVFVSTARELTTKLFNGEFGPILDQTISKAPSERFKWSAFSEELKVSIQKSIIGLKSQKDLFETLSTVFMTFAAFTQALDLYFVHGFCLDEYWDIEIDEEHRIVIDQQSETLEWPKGNFFLILHMGLSKICQEEHSPMTLTGPLTLQGILAWYLGGYHVQLLEIVNERDSSDRFEIGAKALAFSGSTLMGLAKFTYSSS